MSKNSNLGGSSNMRTQIQNLWQAINTIETGGGGGGGTGNMNYIGGSTTVGQHYKTTSTNGLNCDKSSIIETNTDITFGNKNIGAIGDIVADKLVINGGTIQQYLMGDGTLLQQSATGGNSNFYLYNNISGVMSPPPSNGQIGYNTNNDQINATTIYISHRTRDTIDIEVFYNTITQLNDVYIQDQENSINFIRYNITAPPTVYPNSYIEIPVAEVSSGGTGKSNFGNGHNVLVSFFSNLPEIDTRLSTLELKTQNQSSVANQTNFAGTIQADTIQISASSPNLHLMSDGSTRDITTVTNGGPVGGQSLIKTGNGTNPNIQLNSISASNGVGALLFNGNISLSNTSPASDISVASVAGGTSLISSTSANPAFKTKSITQGTGITISDVTNNLTITNSSPASGISLSSIAGGNSLISSTSANPSFKTKSIAQGAGIYIADLSNILYIENTSPASAISLTNAGSGTSLVSITSGNPTFRTKSITQGTGITISELSNNLTISTTTPYLPLTGGTMSGNIDLSDNQIINFNSMTPATGKTLNIGNNAIGYNASINTVVGSSNTSTDNEQWIYGASNTINSNISVAIGSYNNVNSFCGNALGRSNILSAGFSNAIGFNNTCSGQYSVAIGNDITNSTPHSVCLGDNAITTIYPNSLICDLGTSAKPYKDIYYSGKLISATNPILNITHTATLFYNNLTLTSSNSSFIPAGALVAVGNPASQVSQTLAPETARNKIFKSLFSTVSPASFQDQGLLGTTSFLLNGQALYLGMGFNIKISFGVADGGSVAVNSTAGMFVGLVNNTTITWGTTVLPSLLQNSIGIGHNPAGATINMYSRGTSGGDIVTTQWNTTTPDSRWFHLSITNQFNSNIVTVSLTEAVSGVTETNNFTCGTGTLTPATNVRLFPCIQRFHRDGGGVNQAAQVYFGQLTYNQLI